MVDFVLRKHTQIRISISRTIFLTCFVAENTDGTVHYKSDKTVP